MEQGNDVPLCENCTWNSLMFWIHLIKHPSKYESIPFLKKQQKIAVFSFWFVFGMDVNSNMKLPNIYLSNTFSFGVQNIKSHCK